MTDAAGMSPAPGSQADPATDRQLRLATADDVPAIQALIHAAYGPYVDRIGQNPGPMLDDYAALVAQGLVQVIASPIAGPIAGPGGRVDGVLVLIPKPDHLLLDNVAVSPAVQGQGLGRYLLSLAEQTARDLGYDTIRLYTHEKMSANIALYTRLGYAETHRARERGLNRVYFAKPISP